MVLKGKHKETQPKCENLNEEVKMLKEKESTWEEKLKAQEECHKVELEGLCHSNKEAFRKYQKDTKKNLNDALRKWRTNLILHTQVATGLLDLSRVDFNCHRDISTESLNFNVYHPEDKNWETFQREWKHLADFFIPTMPKLKTVTRT